MPRAGEDFFNRLSSFLRDTLYVSAASDEQRCGHIRPTHKKIPPNLKRAWRAALFLFGRDRAAHQSTVFLFGGLVSKLLSNKASFFLNKSKKLQSSVNSIPKGIALWYSYPSTLRTNRRYFFPIHHPENSRESILLMQGNPQ